MTGSLSSPARPPSSGATLEGDRALLDAFRAGERPALQRVAELYLDEVARTLRAGVVVHVEGRPVRLGQDLLEVDLEGLVQETFLRAFKPAARDRYDGVRPFGAWLATIARNLLIDRGRREATRARYTFTTDDPEAFGSTPSDAQDTVETRELMALLATFKADLSDEERAIFEGRYEQELTMKACGERLGLSEIQVRRRDSRLRARLFAFLKEQGYLEHADVRIGRTLL